MLSLKLKFKWRYKKSKKAAVKYTLNNIGSSEGTLQYYYHATPGEPLQGSPGVEW